MLCFRPGNLLLKTQLRETWCILVSKAFQRCGLRVSKAPRQDANPANESELPMLEAAMYAAQVRKFAQTTTSIPEESRNHWAPYIYGHDNTPRCLLKNMTTPCKSAGDPWAKHAVHFLSILMAIPCTKPVQNFLGVFHTISQYALLKKGT